MAYPGGNNPQDASSADIHLQGCWQRTWKSLSSLAISQHQGTDQPSQAAPIGGDIQAGRGEGYLGFLMAGRESVLEPRSVVIHVGVVALLFIIGTNKTVQKVVKEQIQLIAPDLSPYKPTPKKNDHGWRRRRW